MLAFEGFAALARRAERLLQVHFGHPIAAFAIAGDHLAEHVEVIRLAIRRQRHDLVLVGRMQEAQVLRDPLIQQAQRIRQVDLLDAAIVVSVEDPIARGGPLATAVHRQHGAALERRRQERAGLVGHMVFDEVPAILAVTIPLAEQVRQVMRGACHQLPRGVDHVRQEQRVPGRRHGVGRLPARRLQRQHHRFRAGLLPQQQLRVVRIGDVVQVVQADARFLQAVVDRVPRQFPRAERHGPLAVLDMREAFVLRCGDDDAIAHQAGRGVVIGGVNAERVHALPPWECPEPECPVPTNRAPAGLDLSCEPPTALQRQGPPRRRAAPAQPPPPRSASRR